MFERAVPEASFHRAIAGCRPELVAPRADSNPGYSETLRNRRSKAILFAGSPPQSKSSTCGHGEAVVVNRIKGPDGAFILEHFLARPFCRGGGRGTL